MKKRSDREIKILMLAQELNLTVGQMLDGAKLGHNEYYDNYYRNIAKLRLEPFDDWRLPPLRGLADVAKCNNCPSRERIRQIVSGDLYWTLLKFYKGITRCVYTGKEVKL